MEAAATRFYERLGPRYLALARLVYIGAGALLCLVGVVLFGLFVDESRTQFALMLGIAELGVIFSLGWGTAWILDAARPINEWIRAGKPARLAPSAWRTALLLPQRTLVAQGWRALVAAALPTIVAAVVILDLDALEVALFAFSLLVAGSYVTVLYLFMFELELRPIVRELAGQLPRDAQPPIARARLDLKLMLAIPVTNLAAGGFVGLTTVAISDGSVSELGLALLVALAIALSAGLVATVLVVGSILAPVRELLGDIDRISDGALEERTAVLSSDEFGVLAESFNRMLGGLAEREDLRARAGRLEIEAERIAHEQEAEANQAVLEERGRLAREMHDVIAHSISLVVVQAGAARRVAGEDATALDESLEAIELSAVQARTELRNLLGVLERADSASAAERPRTADVEALVKGVREAGVDVTLEMDPRLRELPAGLELSCYRMVQEALTNAVKHAPEATISIVIERDENELELVVENGPPALPMNGSNGSAPEGHGLIGMRERAELHGGELSAQALAGGGFRLRVRLPLDRAASSTAL